MQIALAAQQASDIGRVELLLGDRLIDSSILDRLNDDGIETAISQIPAPAPRPLRIAIGRVPGVQMIRRLKHGTLRQKIRRLARETGARLVYHEPNMITQPIDLPTVSSMNDLSWFHEPSWHPAERLAWIDKNLPHTLKHASRFVAISQFTKAALMQTFGIASERIDVVPLAPASDFQPVEQADAATILARYDLQDRHYVFSISTVEPRKNFDRLLRAYLQLPLHLRDHTPLVIAGGQGWGDVLTQPDAQQAIRTGAVRMLGHVPDADLPILCARAAVFAYVSLYEGFGLPVIEAMATGTAVLASSTTAVGELAMGAAILVDPIDVDDIAKGLQALLEDDALMARMRMAGLDRAADYTWGETIKLLGHSWRRALL